MIKVSRNLLRSTFSSLKFSSVDHSGQPSFTKKRFLTIDSNLMLTPGLVTPAEILKAVRKQLKSFDSLNLPDIGTWFELPHSSVIFQFSNAGNDSFNFQYECRRYFMMSDYTLNIYAAYSDYDESGAHCSRRGMIPGKRCNSI